MSAPEILVAPSEALDHAGRLVALIERQEGRVRRRYLELLRQSRQLATLEELAALLERGRVAEALQIFDDVGNALTQEVFAAYAAAGYSAAEFLRSEVDTVFDFNLANERASLFVRNERARLIRELSQQQRLATAEFLADAFQRGLAPIEQARALKRSLGLTQYQAQIIRNYRRNLEQRDVRALGRALRDRRFDSTIRRAIDTDTPLSAAQIDRMVERYRERWIQYRARTIARTETLRAASAADEELFQQAIDDGVIAAADLQNQWVARLRNTRDSHEAPLHLQIQPFGVPFRSGAGNLLRYPGDPNAPASETINCQCVVARILNSETARGRRAA